MAASEMRGDVASSLEHIVRRPIAKSLKHREAVELLSYLSTVLEGDRIQGDSQVRAYTSATKTVLKTLRALSGGDCLAWGLEGDLIALLAATCKYTRRHDSPVEMQSTKDLLKLLLHYLNAKGSLAHDLCKTLKDLCHSLVFRWSQRCDAIALSLSYRVSSPPSGTRVDPKCGEPSKKGGVGRGRGRGG